MTVDEIITQLHKKIEIIAGFPKDKELVYPPDERKPNSFPSRKSEAAMREEAKLKGTRYKDTRTRGPGGQTVANVANWNEFGTKTKKGTTHTPSRPFMRTAMRNHRDDIIKHVKASFQPSKMKDPNRWNKVGEYLEFIIKDSIESGNWIPNSHRTKMQKLKNLTWKKLQKRFVKYDEINAEWNKIKPLIDTGLMLKSVKYEVKES